MEKIEYQAVIKYLFLKGMPTQIKNKLDAVYGDSAPSFITVKFWAAEFKRSIFTKILTLTHSNDCQTTARQKWLKIW